MGTSSSKPNEALVLCKERTQYIKEAIDARFNLSASHLCYTQSLREIGSSLREFTESELSSDPSLSTSDRASQSSLPSPSNAETESPFSVKPTVSYMKTGGNSVVTVTVDPSTLGLTNQDSNDWDYFEQSTNQSEGLKQSKETETETESLLFIEEREEETEKEELEREICEEELITHRAKEFLASVKDLENRFVRASDAGNELAKMLETNKIRLSVCTDFSSGKPSASTLILALNQVCFKKESLLKMDHTQQASKVITWNRALSSISSSSRGENEDEKIQKNNEFIEQFSMISGSHSSTLDRLYAWEKKLYDEIKASECVRKVYDQKCTILRQQFARDMKAQSIDKTRAIIKDLHSRLCVSIQAVDSISKRIERMRDEELQPQLVELVHEMIRMWRSMLECHHSQFITISLAYHIKRSNPKTEGQNANLTHLLEGLDSFSSSFANWINSQRNYVKALDTWLQKCVLQPQERRRGRRKAIFPPPQALSPPIFVLCKDWLNGIESLPLDELVESIRAVGSVLREDCERKENEMEIFQSGLRGLFDRLNKFAEASLKVCEEVKHSHEVARVAYKMVESSDISVNSRVSL
ncbi:hypothetical protein LUZ60_004284 [Juncus effusus]|nr:hypothetical protein LUZ60_004284 [Juncus effusus]